MQKLKNIEFLRVLCTLFIVIYHIFCFKFLSESSIGIFKTLTCHAQKAVDFFFIMAGFFLIFTFKPTLTLVNLIKKRIIRLWPVMLFILLCYWIASFFGLCEFTPIKNIMTLLFISNIGFPLKIGNSGNLWFVSVMFWCSIFYFLLYKHSIKKYTIPIISFIVIVAYSAVLYHYHGDLRAYKANIGIIFNIGLLRGLAGMGVGYLIAECWNKFKLVISEKFNSLRYAISFGIVESLLLFFLIYNMLFHKFMGNKIILVVVFSLLYWLFLMQKGFVSKICNKDIWVTLSKYSYSIYVVHIFLLHMINDNFAKCYPKLVSTCPIMTFFITFVLIILFGIFTYYVVEVPGAAFLKQKLYCNNTSVNIDDSGRGNP